MSNDTPVEGLQGRAAGGSSGSPPPRSPEPDISQLSFSSSRAPYQPGPDEKAVISVSKNRVMMELPHGFAANDPIIFSGFPPNGINPGSIYFVFSGNIEEKSFQITSVAGGSTTINVNDSNSVFYCSPKRTVVHANVDIEILSDFGELDQFVIDGDGLVAHILSDSCLDWKLGGQFLHAVYLAEVLIGKLLERNAVFTVVFFTESRHVWSHPSHRLLRELLRTILKKNAKDRAIMVQEHRFNLALVDQYRTSCKNFFDRCIKYHKLLAAVEKTLKDIHIRSLKDVLLAKDAVALQQESQSAFSHINFKFADAVINSRNTCVEHLISVEKCCEKCKQDHERALEAVEVLSACMSAANDLVTDANQLESTRIPGSHFVVRDDIPSCNSKQWSDLLESSRPRFVLSTDGRTCGKFSFGPGSVDQTGTFEHWATSYFLMQQSHILASGLSFVFFNGFKISERSVVGTIIQSLGRVARSLDVASAAFVTSKEELLQQHGKFLIEDREIDRRLAAIMNDASITHVQKCAEVSSKFSSDLLSRISHGSVELNQLVNRVKTVISDNRRSYLGSFRVLSELAGKYAQPYPAGSSEEDENRVPSIAECFDPDYEDEEDEEEEFEDSDDDVKPKTTVKIPRTIQIFQESLLLLARTQLEDICAKGREAQCRTEMNELQSRIDELNRNIQLKTNSVSVSVGGAAASSAPSASSSSTPKVDSRDPRSVSAIALARNTKEVVQLSPQEKVEKCQKQVGIKEKSLSKAIDENKSADDVAKARKNLEDAKADLAKAEINLRKHLEQSSAQTSAIDSQIKQDKEQLERLREQLPLVLSNHEIAQASVTRSQEQCKRAESVSKFLSFWSSCFSFRPDEYVVEVEKDDKTVVSPDMAYKQFGSIREQIQQDSSKSASVQIDLRKALQKIPGELQRITSKIAELHQKLQENPNAAKSVEKLADYEKKLQELRQGTIWSHWQFEYIALQKKAKEESEGFRSMQDSTPLSDSQRLAASFCNQFTDHWATWLSLCVQLQSGFDEFKSCLSAVSSDLVSAENLCSAMITDLACFRINSNLLSLSRPQLQTVMEKFCACAAEQQTRQRQSISHALDSGISAAEIEQKFGRLIPDWTMESAICDTLSVCRSLKSGLAKFICSNSTAWPLIIAAERATDLKSALCQASQEQQSWQQLLECLCNETDSAGTVLVSGDSQKSLSHTTWQAIFAAALGRAVKSLCSRFPNFSKFSFSKLYTTLETSAKAAILAVCVGNNLPLALRSITLTAASAASVDLENHLSFLDLVFTEIIKEFPDSQTSAWNLSAGSLIDAFDGRLCAFIMSVGASSDEFLSDFPEITSSLTSAWKIVCEESRFEWQSAGSSAGPPKPWETAVISSFALEGDIFPIKSIPEFTRMLQHQDAAGESELTVFSSQIPVFKRASRNYFFQKGQAILHAMGLDPDEFKRLNYSDAILELANQSDAALEYIASMFEFDDDEHGRKEKEKLKRLIRNPPMIDEEQQRETFYVPQLSLHPASPVVSLPLGVLPEMYLNVNLSYYISASKIKIRKRCKCIAPFTSSNKDFDANCPFKSYHNCKCTANYLTGKFQWNRNCPGYIFHPVTKEQEDKKALKLKQQKAANERVSWLGESSGITTVVNTRVLYHSFRLSLAYDFVKEYNDWKLLKGRFEAGEIPAAEFNSQCDARMQPVKAGEGQVRDMCKQFPQLAIEMMLYRATKMGVNAVAKARDPTVKNFNPAATVYSLICSVISMFGPNNLPEWEEVRAVFLYYPEIPRVENGPSGTKTTIELLDVLSQYGERAGLDGQSLDKYRNIMVERLFKWRSVFESKEMLSAVGGGSGSPNHFDKVMREFRLFVGKMFYTYGFKKDLERLNSQPGDLLWDPMIDWKMQQDGWDSTGLDRHVTSAVVFQLRHMGHMLTRSDGEMPDPRITGWIPDRWQTDLLDIVEGSLDNKTKKDGSVLVCAPTSAGKTFIAIHVMRKVCKSENQRVIYVAPTKALCNEVQTRLKADFPNEIGSFSSSYMELFQGRWEPVISENLLKYRTDIMGGPGTSGKSTKILVLEPRCLEELLLSSDPDVLAWREQLVYVIFDEVHCLSTDPVWERLLAMVSCPFIALSATIGNPQHFLSWLQTVQNEAETGRQVKLVEHKTRYVDLRRHLYLPPASLPEKYDIVNQAKLSLKINCDHTSDLSGNILKHLHPLCHLTQSSFDAGQISSSLRQEPRDCMQTFDTMSEEITAALEDANKNKNVGDIPVLELAAAAVKELHPDQFFGFVLSVNRWSVVSYENALNQLLISWSQNPVLKPVAAKALIKLGNMWLCPEAVASALPEVTCQKNISGDLESISKHVLNLLCNLHQQDRLPALVFNFDTTMVESLAISTAQALEEAEAKYVEINSKVLSGNRKMAEARDAKITKLREQQKVTTDAANGTSNKDTKNLKLEADQFGDDIDLEGHLDSFTFMRVGGRNDEEVKGAKEKIMKMPGHTKDMLLRCLHRGIGIHHEGLPTKYRHLCEKLFRMGFLRVVFSTDTLAYGINMPCRAVVFAGDSVFLNSVQFQQMAGRAGRRGLDVLGHVVFCALPLHRLHRLVISGVPQMNGKHPELPVLVPKVLKYCQGLRYSRKSTELCQRLVFDPLVHFNSNKSTFLWHMIACGHYMYHAGYVEQTPEGDRLTASGQLLAFAHSMAPAHFAFCHLYESGLLNEMCSDSALNLGQKCRALLLVLVALFKPLALNSTHLKSRHTSRGQIMLTNLNEPRTDGFLLNIYPYLQRVNDQLQVFEQTSRDILLSHASAAVDRESNRLKFAGPSSAGDMDFTTPLTEVSYKRGKRLSGKPTKGGLIERLIAQQRAFKCSSPFVASSGHGDSFPTVAQFSENAAPSLGLGSSVILPSLLVSDPFHQTLNAAIVDFYVHGEGSLLETENGIRRTDIFTMFVAINCLILLHALTGDRLDDFFNILRLLSFALTARPPDAAEAKTLQEYDIQPERSDIDPKKVVRHVYVPQKNVHAAQHGPVAFVMSTLFEDFKKKFGSWVESV